MPAKTWRLDLIVFIRRVVILHQSARFLKRIARAFSRTIRESLRFLCPGKVYFGPARGSFSVSSLVRSRGVKGRIILDSQGEMKLKERSIIKLCGLKQNSQQPWPIFWSHHPNARLIGPGLALINDNKEVALESADGAEKFKKDPAWNFCPVRPAQKLEGPWTSLVSTWARCDEPVNYAHWLFEALPRLAVLGEFPRDTRILVPKGLQPFQIESLKWLGVDHRIVETNSKHLRVEQFFFSSPSAMIVCYNPYAVDFLRSNFLRFASSSYKSRNRFYIQRAGQFRAAANEQELTKFFQDLGWDIVDTAKLTLSEQIALFRDAEVICGVHGAAFSNLLWCRPGCTVIEFFADNYLNGCFEWLSHCVQANHHFLIFPGDAALNAVIDLKRVRALLKEIKAL